MRKLKNEELNRLSVEEFKKAEEKLVKAKAYLLIAAEAIYGGSAMSMLKFCMLLKPSWIFCIIKSIWNRLISDNPETQNRH